MSECTPELASKPVPAGNLLEFLAWVAARPRTYSEAMEAWRTSCPRLSAWEDAMGADLVRVDQENAPTQGQAAVLLTATGAAFLRSARLTPVASGSSSRGESR